MFRKWEVARDAAAPFLPRIDGKKFDRSFAERGYTLIFRPSPIFRRVSNELLNPRIFSNSRLSLGRFDGRNSSITLFLRIFATGSVFFFPFCFISKKMTPSFCKSTFIETFTLFWQQRGVIYATMEDNTNYLVSSIHEGWRPCVRFARIFPQFYTENTQINFSSVR